MPGDLYFDKVVLLLHCEGTDASTTFTDSSRSGRAITANGTAQIDTAQYKFGSAAGLFDGNSDFLTFSDSADWDFGTGDYTVEAWVRLASTTGAQTVLLLGDYLVSGNGAVWYIEDGKLTIYQNNTKYQAGSATVSANTWTHVAWSRTGGDVSFQSGGTRAHLATVSSAIAPSTHFAVGADVAPALDTSFFNGWLDDLRITKGTGRYSGATYTEPTAAFPDYREVSGAGAPASAAAAIAGSGTVTGERIGTGALAAQAAAILGTGRAFTTLTGTGTLGSQAASLAAVGGIAITPSLPVAMNVLQPVVVGLPVRIDIRTAVTPSLPIRIGAYPVTPTLPIRMDVLRAATLPTLPISIAGKWTDAGLVTWTPKCVLDGTDISSSLIGAQDIEFEEDAAPVATFSFIPAAGAVDPLCWVGKKCSLSWVTGNTQILCFSGIVSDPEWDAESRTVTISATGDLQSKLDAMEKTAIASLVGGTFSEYIFDDPDNLSGFEYAAARISTTPNTLWQDRQGWIRTTSVLAKATADYTFTNASILDAARVVRWQGRMDITNTQYVTLAYRFKRRRQRHMTFNFRPWQLETPSTYLSGNEGGWELPQRSMIESAANGGGWTVIGDIVYQPVWPNGIYSTYSDSGVAMMEGLSLTPEVAADWCIGARWTAAKRWLQTVTENYSMVVTASDSIEAVGTLATEESYAIEDEADDETWESSLDYDDYVSGATLMANNVDKKADLDTLRSDVTTAMAVALAKAQNEVLKSHRGTTVSFLTTFHPIVDLSHTVAVDTTYLDAKGKVRRVAHHWDIESGDATTEIELALSRHNGSGLASTDTLTPPSEPGDPDETSPERYHQLLMHLGGQDNMPVWDDSWDGFIVNLPYLSTAGSNTLLGSWARNPANPGLNGRIYEEGFHVLPPQIDAAYANPVDVTGAATYDVEIPEDTLVLISG